MDAYIYVSLFFILVKVKTLLKYSLLGQRHKNLAYSSAAFLVTTYQVELTDRDRADSISTMN